MSAYVEFKKLSNPEELILRLVMGRSISYALAKKAFSDVLNETDDTSRRHYMAMILNGMLARRATPDEVAGLLDAIFEFDDFDPKNIRTIKTSRSHSITLAGSGKKGFKTVNISSLSAFVLAAADITVAKICAPSTSSKTGSEEFASMIGADISISTAEMEKVMEDVGVGFYSVSTLLPNFSQVYTGNFYSPHALVFAIAPLAAPFQTDKLIFGLAHPDSQLALKLMQMYGRSHALTVGSTYDGIHFIDEVSDIGGVHIDGYRSLDEKDHHQRTVYFNDITGVTQKQATIAISQEDNIDANLIKGLSGLVQPDSVLAKQIALNASVMLQTCTENQNMQENYQKCLEIIESGKPLELMRDFVKATGNSTAKLDDYIKKARTYESKPS